MRQVLYTLRDKKASDLRKHYARGGTRTRRHAPETRHFPEITANPPQCATGTTESEAPGCAHCAHPLFAYLDARSREVVPPSGPIRSGRKSSYRAALRRLGVLVRKGRGFSMKLWGRGQRLRVAGYCQSADVAQAEADPAGLVKEPP
jgi:hypothetical protein